MNSTVLSHSLDARSQPRRRIFIVVSNKIRSSSSVEQMQAKSPGCSVCTWSSVLSTLTLTSRRGDWECSEETLTLSSSSKSMNDTVTVSRHCSSTASEHITRATTNSTSVLEARLRFALSSSPIVRHAQMSNVNDLAFPVAAAARIWQRRPRYVASAPSVRVFCRRLTTRIFNCSFSDFVLCLWSHFCHYRTLVASIIYLLTYLLTYSWMNTETQAAKQPCLRPTSSTKVMNSVWLDVSFC